MGFPELTRAQMRERCDLNGVARVVSVGRASPDSPHLAKLRFVQVVKGEARERGGFVYVRLHGGVATQSETGLASWSDWWDYPVGALVETHLDWNGPEELYQTTWPGAVVEVIAHEAQMSKQRFVTCPTERVCALC